MTIAVAGDYARYPDPRVAARELAVARRGPPPPLLSSRPGLRTACRVAAELEPSWRRVDPEIAQTAID